MARDHFAVDPCSWCIPDRVRRVVPFDLILFALLLIFIASQIFWIGRIIDLGERLIPGKPRRVWLAIIAGLVYLFVFAYSYPEWGLGDTNPSGRLPAAEHAYSRGILVVVRGIDVGFVLSDCFRGGRPCGPCRWVGLPQSAPAMHEPSAAADAGTADPLSPGRRHFLERTAVLSQRHSLPRCRLWASLRAAERGNRSSAVRLARLPKAFEGFHIAQLSDIHIGPFTPCGLHSPLRRHHQRIRTRLDRVDRGLRCWDPEDQGGVVRVLAGLRAPSRCFRMPRKP